jgi:hypothetical protein
MKIYAIDGVQERKYCGTSDQSASYRLVLISKPCIEAEYNATVTGHTVQV